MPERSNGAVQQEQVVHLEQKERSETRFKPDDAE